MLDCDTLFFYQLMLPIIHTSMSGIEEDRHLGFYEDVARKSNLYTIGVKNRGGTRRHVFCPINAEELLIWDGIVYRNLNSNIAESWMMSQSNTFDREVAEAMYFRQWLG
jgi:hypothetical protein